MHIVYIFKNNMFINILKIFIKINNNDDLTNNIIILFAFGFHSKEICVMASSSKKKKIF
jgi:hypothetical protein